jgi:hypothetical protein
MKFTINAVIFVKMRETTVCSRHQSVQCLGFKSTQIHNKSKFLDMFFRTWEGVERTTKQKDGQSDGK